MLFTKKAAVCSAISLALLGCNSSSDSRVSMDLRLMETTDLHGNMMPFDYFANKYEPSYGFARTALIINEARSEVNNSMLFDNGDLIQGSPMADYIANQFAQDEDYLKSNPHPVYKAMNLMDYDAANIGNHEFNYGLDFLDAATEHANFPYVVSNVFEYDENLLTADNFDTNSCELRVDSEFLGVAKPFFEPYVMLDRTFTARNGEDYTIKVGVIGFTPPNIMSWDKSHLECEVVVSDIKQTAAHYVPLMKEQGADIIVAVPHSGLTGADLDVEFADNATWQLAKIDGIDAIMFGHDHNNFPTTAGSYDGMEGVDAPAGKIFGKPAVMPGFWGNHVGVIDLVLETRDEGETWAVNYGQSTAELRTLPEDQTQISIQIAASVAKEHTATQEYMAEPILGISQKINSFFSAIKPDLSVQIVNEAQFHWGQQLIEEGELEIKDDEILLSVSAPFKGGRGGRDDYTDINGTELTNASVADLYVFDNNTPAILKLTVADVKEWLETIASQQYKTVANEGDDLLHQMFRSYNYDVFYGGWKENVESNALHYTIDVSQEPRYLVDGTGELVGETPQLDPNDNRRIGDITYNGEVLDDTQVVYVVTNNYRASNNWIPGVDNAELVLEDAAYSNRELVDQYLKHLAEESVSPVAGTVPEHEFVNAENFSLIGSQGLTVNFLSSPRAEEFAGETDSIEFTNETGSVGDNEGYSVYTYTFE
ncbi:2,' 3'-cyclic nucleotide 2'-phosphodiesterase [Vibrio breoganii]|uniref:2,' 3'-cyclic nucleotide 2'-phosphodiesterase n=1 Tax=Vibrio breoganii TaxID=553239 RepID=A0AAN0XV58_9VIBR|nr:bifunctional 2',3'-cyclic-nucleotide 2'-phosphodiesterase/3'-nucleotidase [Vibrio breoganii]ANO33282.1 2,' 3'-cyclic nucleotide 2'-phosphodiesterase [Vibrio breoganii]PMG86284.1 2,' 3'-cyclic nucleotide 2'-phosphodiesterase [Vibrio breoganii]PMK47646.1 2,' 3'-cyclic nucleotide 2'-phosphodiesterase [Vibrio breoganii]